MWLLVLNRDGIQETINMNLVRRFTIHVEGTQFVYENGEVWISKTPAKEVYDKLMNNHKTVSVGVSELATIATPTELLQKLKETTLPVVQKSEPPKTESKPKKVAWNKGLKKTDEVIPAKKSEPPRPNPIFGANDPDLLPS